MYGNNGWLFCFENAITLVLRVPFEESSYDDS